MSDNQIEQWRDINGFEGLYQASNFGRIRSIDRYVPTKRGNWQFFKGVVRKPHTTTTCDYLVVVLSKQRVFTNHLVHRLIASAFLGLTEDSNLEVNHKDGNKHNNRLDNLELVTRTENIAHATRMGLKHDQGENHVHAKLTQVQANKIRQRVKNGEKRSFLAKEYGVSFRVIDLIIQNKTYKNENYKNTIL